LQNFLNLLLVKSAGRQSGAYRSPGATKRAQSTLQHPLHTAGQHREPLGDDAIQRVLWADLREFYRSPDHRLAGSRAWQRLSELALIGNPVDSQAYSALFKNSPTYNFLPHAMAGYGASLAAE
jgi:hypothetical protein